MIVVLENSRAIYDDEDRIVAHEGTITDITERKRAETRVFEEKERAQVTLQSIGDGVITTDADGNVDYINPVAQDLTGWDMRSARGNAGLRTHDDRQRAHACDVREPGRPLPERRAHNHVAGKLGPDYQQRRRGADSGFGGADS